MLNHFLPTRRCLTFLLIGSWVLLANTAMAQETVKAEDVIKMHIKQLGGEEKLKAVKTVEQQFVMVISGPGGDMEADCELLQDGNKFRMMMNLPGFGEIQQGSNGKTYWTSNPAEGNRLMDDEETALAKEQYSRPFPALDWLKDYDGQIEMQGKADVEGNACYKIKFEPSVGTPITRYFAVEDGKMLRFDATQKGMAGEVDISVYLSDFKQVDGITLPFKQDTQMEQAQADMSMEVDSIKFNQEMKADRFQLPAAIQKLVDDKK
ncbi:MAG: hypothetical protein MK108_03520 [Mariniblastus sp.]|nr:hypothetical protein [Mariniblastus sp.]